MDRRWVVSESGVIFWNMATLKHDFDIGPQKNCEVPEKIPNYIEVKRVQAGSFAKKRNDLLDAGDEATIIPWVCSTAHYRKCV